MASVASSPSYAELKKQIAALEVQAAKQKTAEVAGVVAKIREAIALHGLTAQDLFTSARGVSAKQKPVAGAAAKFTDGKGGTWGGRGKRPQWLRDALGAGRTLEEFLTHGAVADTPSVKAPAKKGAKAKPAKKAATAKYKDGAGHAWSGMGPKPQWFKDALAAGKTLEDLRG